MHRIRLRQPWIFELRPGSNSGEDPQEQLCFSRRFNRPTGLSATQSVRLALSPRLPEPEWVPPRVAINGVELALQSDAEGRLTAEIAMHLQPANEVCLCFDAPAQGGPSREPERSDITAWVDVALWIADG